MCVCVCVLCVPASVHRFHSAVLNVDVGVFLQFWNPLAITSLDIAAVSLFFWDLKYKYDGPFCVSHVSSVLSVPSSPYSAVLVLSIDSVSELTSLVLCYAEFSVKPSDECLMQNSLSCRSRISM